jgi:hypothetical protein
VATSGVVIVPSVPTHDGLNTMNVTIVMDKQSEVFRFTRQNQISVSGSARLPASPPIKLDNLTYVVVLELIATATPGPITITAAINALGLNKISHIVVEYGACACTRASLWRAVCVFDQLPCVCDNLLETLVVCACAAPSVIIEVLTNTAIPGQPSTALGFDGLSAIALRLTFSSIVRDFVPNAVSVVGSAEMQRGNLTVVQLHRVYIVNAVPNGAPSAAVTLRVAQDAVNSGRSVASANVTLRYGGHASLPLLHCSVPHPCERSSLLLRRRCMQSQSHECFGTRPTWTPTACCTGWVPTAARRRGQTPGRRAATCPQAASARRGRPRDQRCSRRTA